MEVDPSPSQSQQAGQKKRKKNKQQKLKPKAALSSPLVATWPAIGKDDEDAILILLRSALSSADLRPSSVILSQSNGQGKKKTPRPAPATYTQNRPAGEKNLRSQLAIGMNEVMKGLESDQLQLVVVSRACWEIIKHIATAVAARHCAGVAVSSLQTVQPLLGLPNDPAAIGFRMVKPGGNTQFKAIIDFIIPKCPPMQLPWFQMERELLQMKQENATTLTATESVTQVTKQTNIAPGHHRQAQPPTPLADYSHFYVSRKSSPEDSSAGDPRSDLDNFLFGETTSEFPSVQLAMETGVVTANSTTTSRQAAIGEESVGVPASGNKRKKKQLTKAQKRARKQELAAAQGGVTTDPDGVTAGQGGVITGQDGVTTGQTGAAMKIEPGCADQATTSTPFWTDQWNFPTNVGGSVQNSSGWMQGTGTQSFFTGTPGNVVSTKPGSIGNTLQQISLDDGTWPRDPTQSQADDPEAEARKAAKLAKKREKNRKLNQRRKAAKQAARAASGYQQPVGLMMIGQAQGSNAPTVT